MSFRIKTPVTIYIVHHPECEEAEQLASRLHDWFRLGHLTGDSGEAGLPVHFRRCLKGNSVHPAIDFGEAELNVVIALVDQLAVVNDDWRTALANLSGEVTAVNNDSDRRRALLLPAAMHESFYRVSPIYQQFNPVRLMEMMPDEMLATIRRAATEATARILRSFDQQNPPPLDVFLSHAKRDGKEIAESLRDRVRSFGQMVPWYDANDLPYGSDWESPMMKAARDGTAAMVATVTDAYSTRPWCRREAALARTPRRSDPDSDRVWHVQPVVAVHNADRQWVRSIPMLQGVPRMGWDNKASDLARVVDRLGLEVLLGLVHRRVAGGLDREHQRESDMCFITWVPDAWTLCALRHALGKQAEAIRRIVYPGFGLTTVERSELEPVYKSFHPDTELVSFEEVWKEDDEEDAEPSDVHVRSATEPQFKKSLIVGLSAGGNKDELAEHGYGLEHIDELMVRIARRLLADGHQLAFGGTLGDSDDMLTESLIDAALGWLEHEAAKRVDINKPQAWPLVNHSPWPFYTRISTERRASLVGICRFVNVDPEGVAREDLDRELAAWKADDKYELSPQGLLYYSNALTTMRQNAADATDMRVIWGGRVAATGWMPGILEEVNHSLGKGKPVVVLGGFGGCSGRIAKFLGDESLEWPKNLPTVCHEQSRDALLSNDEAQTRLREGDDTKNRLTRYRRRLFAEKTVCGISTQMLREQALTTLSTRQAVSIAALAARAVRSELEKNHSDSATTTQVVRRKKSATPKRSKKKKTDAKKKVVRKKKSATPRRSRKKKSIAKDK